ncbi:NADAR family protein [Candidatus Finniella inopinata]|uniref:NADAR family protein n=1 Tax=Candidatus Finniella inopinata TaxID=1696036 RepID=A0A4Q7DJK2_9PROT|nr:NADAR family protein [Candidatus Finniella inopinata]RZI47043.1 NADAR family protein [Candidatus Finniella inopinata]
MKRKSLLMMSLAGLCLVVQPIFCQTLLEQELARTQPKSVNGVDPFYNPANFYEPTGPLSSKEQAQQKECAQLLLKTLTQTPDKVGALQRSVSNLETQIRSNSNSSMVMHYLCVTSIIYLNNVFECNLVDYRTNSSGDTKKGFVDRVENVLRRTSMWQGVMSQVDEFKRAYDKNATAGKWGGVKRATHKITDRIDGYDWLRIFAEITAERLDCLPEFFHMETESNGWGSNYYYKVDPTTQQSEGWFKGPDGIVYQTSEHYFQAHKFVKGTQAFNAVVAAADPGAAKRLATGIHNGPTNKISNNWHGIGPGPIDSEGPCPFDPGRYNTQLQSLTYKDRVMVRALYYKFTQNPFIKQKLIAIGFRPLIENTSKAPYPDGYWGNDIEDPGVKKRPVNMLGLLLAALREHFRDPQNGVTFPPPANSHGQAQQPTSGYNPAAAAPAVPFGAPAQSAHQAYRYPASSSTFQPQLQQYAQTPGAAAAAAAAPAVPFGAPGQYNAQVQSNYYVAPSVQHYQSNIQNQQYSIVFQSPKGIWKLSNNGQWFYNDCPTGIVPFPIPTLPSRRWALSASHDGLQLFMNDGSVCNWDWSMNQYR